jgi:hypothetical protein
VGPGEEAGAEFVRFEAVTREYRVRFFTLKHYQKANKEAVRAWAPEDVAGFLRAADLAQHLDLFQVRSLRFAFRVSFFAFRVSCFVWVDSNCRPNTKGKGGAELVHMADHQLSKIYRLKQEPTVRAQLLAALQRCVSCVVCRVSCVACRVSRVACRVSRACR